MDQFDELLMQADAAICDHLGGSARFVGAKGEIQSFGVIIDKDQQVLKEDGYTVLRQTHASFSKPDFEICADDQIISPSGSYRVASVLTDDGSMVSCVVVRRG